MLTEKETHQLKIILSLLKIGTHSCVHIILPSIPRTNDALSKHITQHVMTTLPGSVYNRLSYRVARYDETIVRFFAYDKLGLVRGSLSDVLWLLGPIDSRFTKEDEQRLEHCNRMGLNPLVFIGDSV